MMDKKARQQQLKALYENLQILLEREAKYGGTAPLSLLNQINDHRQAIEFIQAALDGHLSSPELDEALAPLLLAIQNGQVVNITAGAGSAVVTGQGGRATVFNVNIRDIRWLPIVLILLLTLGVMAYLFLQLRPKRPEKMGGQFNVAVAEFLVEDESGKRLSSEDGQALATYLYQQIQTNFVELQLEQAVPYEVWGPAETGSIEGRTRAEREQAALARAGQIDADIIIYGVMIQQGRQSRLIPEFLVSHSAFQEADEIVGQHELGNEIRLNLPFNSQIQAIENKALAGRVHALSLITLGLAYLVVDNPEAAIPYFQQAANEERWVDSAGKEVAYMLLGGAYGKHSTIELNPEFLVEASQAFSRALEINPNYGRAKVALATVFYIQAQGDAGQTLADPALLEKAEMLLDEALQLPNQPESANLETNVHYRRGVIALLRYLTRQPGGNWLELARNELNYVIQDFEAGDERIEQWAAHAYARLGFIEGSQQNYEAAIPYLKQAIEHASPFFQGRYNTWLASIYAASNQPNLAKAALEEAIAIAEANGDAASVKRYHKLLNDFLNGP